MQALITGVAGFIGSRLASRILDEGWQVIGIDSLTDYYDPRLKLQNLESLESPRFSFVRADLNSVDVVKLLSGVEYVFHQAGQPGVRKSWGSDFNEYVTANVTATQRLLEGCRKVGSIKRIVYASSSSVYGEAERFPTHETDRPQPRSPYGVTKLAAEHLCSLYAANFDLPTVALRYFTVYGPGQRADMAFTRFIRSALLGEEIDLYGSGEQIRDFTYIGDVVDANVRAAIGDTSHGAVFNVAGGTRISMLQAVSAIEALVGRELRIKKFPSPAGDVMRTGGDTAAIRGALNWVPKMPFTEGLRAQVVWLRNALD